MASVVGLVESIKTTLLMLGPSISIILIVLGAITYGLAQTQPSENRGKWQSMAMGMIVGGIIVAALTGAAQLIADTSSTLLK